MVFLPGIHLNKVIVLILFLELGADDGFKIKLAYSDDLVTWQRCSEIKDFYTAAMDHLPYQENNDLYLFTIVQIVAE